MHEQNARLNDLVAYFGWTNFNIAHSIYGNLPIIGGSLACHKHKRKATDDWSNSVSHKRSCKTVLVDLLIPSSATRFINCIKQRIKEIITLLFLFLLQFSTKKLKLSPEGVYHPSPHPFSSSPLTIPFHLFLSPPRLPPSSCLSHFSKFSAYFIFVQDIKLCVQITRISAVLYLICQLQ